MLRITFRIGGREVRPEDSARNVVSETERRVLEAMTQRISEKLGPLRCPRHGIEPEIVIVGPALDQLTHVEVTNPCCEDIERILRGKVAAL
jgi:hypothetical protein